MRRPPIRILDVAGSRDTLGAVHGASFAEEIRSYTRERVDLVAAGAWSGGPLERGDVLEIARSMLPAHESFHPGLHREMLAMADAAGIEPAEAVIVGGFTDFVDTVRAITGGPTPPALIEDDCTAVIVPDRLADGAGFLAQTWDMHDSATDHVALLRLRPQDAPALNVFTTTGCLGQIGMNVEGVCVGINNLTGLDGRRGVTWPSVVRAMLERTTAEDALAVLLDAELAGAHNFLVFDRHGAGYDVEAFPTERVVVELGHDVLAHTNHALHDATVALEAARAIELTESSVLRLDIATSMLRRRIDEGREIDRDTLEELLREPTAVCQRAAEPLHIESSGAAIMRPATGDFWACWGRPDVNDVERVAMPLRHTAPPPDLPGEPVWVAPSGVRYFHLDRRWASWCEELEHQAFPNTARDDLIDEAYAAALAEDFPEGNFVGVDDNGVPICTGFGIRTGFDFDRPQHTIDQLIAENIVARDAPPSGHVTDGEWYYGLTIVVRPDHRRRGIGGELYELRKGVVRRHGLRGIVAGGVIPGYAEHRMTMTPEEYVERVVAGELTDRTLSFQLAHGFEVRGVIRSYLRNPLVRDAASLIVWPNDALGSADRAAPADA